MPSTPLRSPREFFSQRTPSLSSAAIILYVIGVIAVSSGVPSLDQVTSVETSPGLALFAVLLGGAFGAAGIWAVYTIVIYLTTAVVGGSGTFKQTAANVGWGLLPLLFVNTISSVVVWLLYIVGEAPTITPTHVQLPLWLDAINGVINTVGYIWIGYIFVYAIHDARNVSIRRAAVIAGLISLISVIYSFSLFFDPTTTHAR